jgi:hypothetical protein
MTTDKRYHVFFSCSSLTCKSQLAHIPEDRIIETSVFKNLQSHCNYLKNDCDRLREMTEKLTSEVEELRFKREKFLTHIQVFTYLLTLHHGFLIPYPE